MTDRPQLTAFPDLGFPEMMYKVNRRWTRGQRARTRSNKSGLVLELKLCPQT